MSLRPTQTLRWRHSFVLHASSSSSSFKGTGQRHVAKRIVKPRPAGVEAQQQSRAGQTSQRPPPEAEQTSFASPLRVKGGKKGSVWQSWRNLSFRTRMIIAMAMGGVGIIGLQASDYLERRMPVEGRREEQRPKLFGIRVVDRPTEKDRAV